MRHAGLPAALDSLAALAARDLEVRRNGHDLAHLLGQFAFRVRGDPAVFAECNAEFESGCYHGVLQSYFATRPAVDSQAVVELCGRLAATNAPPLVRRECAHGLGHGLAGYHAGRVDQALAACDHLQLDTTRAECHRGAFMERLTQPASVAGTGDAAAAHAHGPTPPPASAPAHVHGENPTPTAPTASPRTAGSAPCADVAARYQAACWWYVPALVESPDPAAWPAAARVCERAPAAVRRTCWRGVGNQLGVLASDEPRLASRVCATVPADARDVCVAGAAEQQVDMDWSGARARRFCEAMSGSDAAACTSAAMSRLALTARDERVARQLCDAAGAGAASCLDAWRMLRPERRP